MKVSKLLLHSAAMEQKPKVLVIVGPTASGKTSLSVRLAQAFSGEVISADSRQVYRNLDIGTAKITEEEMAGVPHHCIDIADVATGYTAKHFVADAQQAIADITARGNLPIIAGGTFFYVDLLLGRATMPEVEPNPALRERLEQYSAEELYAELRERDSARAETVDSHNKRRLIRALEIVAALGRVPKIPTEEPYNTLWLGIQHEREALRTRLTKRAENWLSPEFKAEIEWLLDQNLPPERITELGFEYQLGVDWVAGRLKDEDFVETFVAKNWQYAKRQLQWLGRNEDIHWLPAKELEEADSFVRDWIELEK
jgi:tRNA dimethylallyltransferase